MALILVRHLLAGQEGVGGAGMLLAKMHTQHHQQRICTNTCFKVSTAVNK
jgi:hypothetical protein